MFKVFTQLSEFKKAREELHNVSIGLVPTMGNLHAGHISLVKKSLAENELTIVSIFVNPTQFGPNEDFDKYPRTLEDDLNLLREASSGRDFWVFAPKSIEEIYPKGFSTQIAVQGELTSKLCGPIRPGHFEGVATVVYLLFAISKPNVAYFGQKDFQQTRVIKRMVRDLFLPVTISVLPIIREDSGLAMSSRNQYLTAEQKAEALKLYHSLKKIAEEIKACGIEKGLALASQLKREDSRFEYLEILESEDLKVPSPQDQKLVIAGVLKMGQTRLLDNLLVEIN
ncbi:MAG: pantoate--beta-alanine ligase [Bdellovibrio sp.]